MARADEQDEYHERIEADSISQALSSRYFSQKYVPLSTKNEVLHSTCQAIKRLRYTLRWRHYHSNDLNFTAEQDTEPDLNFDLDGLNSGCKIKNYNKAPEASPEIELFIKNLTSDLLNNLRSQPVSNPDQEKVSEILDNLRNRKDILLAKSDKTGRFVEMNTELYISILENEISKNSKEITRNEAQQSIESLTTLLEENKKLFNKNEHDFIQNYLDLKKVLTAFGLVKDHKNIQPGQNYPVRLILPESGSYSYGWKRVLTLGLKNILTQNGVLEEVNRNLILNSFECKKKLEKLNLGSKFSF